MTDISIVIPIHNERDNIRPLYEDLQAVMLCLGRAFEILFVDDGSTDGSHRELEALAVSDNRVKVIELRRNFGQTAALAAGIEYAAGDVIVTMDGDLQNDPADIPLLLETLDEGFDLVHGWRKDRRDPYLNRVLPSRIANALISRVTGFAAHDLGCSLKAMRREIAQELRLYGEMHRFIPILAHWRGARCCEVVTRHRPRRFGESKYGLSRVTRVLLDLATVAYLIRYLASPMKLFGSAGLLCGGLGLAAAGLTAWMKFTLGVDMTGNPLLLLSAFSILVGVQFFGLGILGELGARIYFEVQNDEPQAVRRFANLGDNVAEFPIARGTMTGRRSA